METNTRKLTIGTRGSKLALVQTEEVKRLLQEAYPKLEIDVQIIKTMGDKILDVALSKIGDKGLFTKELEVALINGEIDLAVHSLKDIPTKLPPGLTIGAITKREEPSDCVVMQAKHKHLKIETLPSGSIIGTSSLRRVSQLKKNFPHLEFKDVRGNLQTRMQKLDDGQYDALILAVAGLERLELKERIHQVLPKDLCLHAVGQGALGIECRENDSELLHLLKTIHNSHTEAACEAERAFLRETEGGCQVPIGVRTQVENDILYLKGIILSVDGTKSVTGDIQGPTTNAKLLGKQLAEKLKKEGADVILKEVFESVKKG